MDWDGVDRRRGPRVAVGDQFDCRFEMRARVKLVDISATGALLTTDTLLPVEATGRLKAMLGGAQFSPSLGVKRVFPLARAGELQLGTIFLDMDGESRRSLDAFLKKATT